MGEVIWKSCIQEEVNIQITYRTHTTQQYKNKQPD